MTHALQVMSAGDVGALTRALRAALTGDGPAVLPRAAEASGAPNVAPGRAAAGGLDLTQSVTQNVALVIETSGSTGVPKRVALSRDALLASAAASAGTLGGQGQWLLCLPGHYVAGSNVLVRSIVAETTPVVMAPGHFDPAGFRDAAAGMTGDGRYVSLVPVQLARLVAAARQDAGLLAVLRRFDGILVGGQSLPRELHERARELGLAVTRTYGSSETGGGCVYDGIPIGTVRARALTDTLTGTPIGTPTGAFTGAFTGAPIGTPIGAGSETAGALELSGPVLAEGYLGEPARTADAFHIDNGIRWYRTGDLGTVTAEGRVTVIGRADNVIISGGEKVLLDAVERRVQELPGLAAAVVVAADSAEWGQVPVVVVAGPGHAAGETTPALPELRSHVAASLGRAAAPARIVRIDAMPLLASGKPDRLELARLEPARRDRAWPEPTRLEGAENSSPAE